VIILHVLEPFASGVTTAIAGIASELKDCRHIVIHGLRNWVEAEDKVKRRFPSNAEFIEWKTVRREISPRGDFAALRELMAILRKYFPAKKIEGAEPAVVHLHSSKAGFLGRLAARLLGIKSVVYTPHCGAFLRTDIGGGKRFLYKTLEKLGALFGGRVVGCGPSEGEIFAKLLSFCKAGKTATFVSNGVEPRKNISGEKRTLASFAGIATAQKSPALFKEIAQGCADAAKSAGVSFLWIGDGPEASSLEGVPLSGWKSADETENLLEKTLIFLSCSAWEGLPYGVLEAMNAGCALLLRNVPGNRDLVREGENVFLFEGKSDGIEKLKMMLADGDTLQAMGEKSRAILEDSFSLKSMGENWRKIYEEAAQI
jgi:glycosyltransferase involved in cell wall biosynthesis